RARTPGAKRSGVDEDPEEHLVVTIQDTDTVVVTHRFTSSRYAAKGAIFSCNHRNAITTSGDHRLSGKLQNGVIVGVMAHEDPPDTDCKVCGLCVTSDKMFVMKI